MNKLQFAFLAFLAVCFVAVGSGTLTQWLDKETAYSQGQIDAYKVVQVKLDSVMASKNYIKIDGVYTKSFLK